MFSLARSRALHDVVWSTAPYEAEYIEAWKPTSSCASSAENIQFGRLRDSDIEEWLLQKGKYSPPKPPSQEKGPVGGIRLIIAERAFYRPPSLSISRESYLRIEEEFHLPPVSLQTLFNEGGLCSRFEEYDATEPGKLRRLGIVIKVPQKYQVGNYGLALSYDFATCITTGLLVGTGVIQGESDFPVWPNCPRAEIFDLIKAVPSLLAHPLLLPLIILQHHTYRTDTFCNFHLDEKYTAILHLLGTNHAGRLHKSGPYKDPVGKKTIEETRVNLRYLTGEMSTFMTEVTWYCKISEWHCECVAFLAQVLTDVTRTPDSSNNISNAREDREMKEYLEHLGSAVRALQRQNTGSKERAEADFGVLHSIIAQLDNRLNAKISASSSRDSMAMKALAFITTLFLPGTFVATVFSMSMFNWQASASNESSTRVVSSYFWIYWVVTLPLTCIVAFSWRIWWNWERRNFDRDVRTEIENIEAVGSEGSEKIPAQSRAENQGEMYKASVLYSVLDQRSGLTEAEHNSGYSERVNQPAYRPALHKGALVWGKDPDGRV